MSWVILLSTFFQEQIRIDHPKTMGFYEKPFKPTRVFPGTVNIKKIRQLTANTENYGHGQISLKTKPYSDPLLINEEIMELISFVL